MTDARADPSRTRIVLVTGMSGAGRSSALAALEDAGYEAIDNLPLSLLGNLVRGEGLKGSGLALDIDIRTRDFSVARFTETVNALFAQSDVVGRLLFIDCDDEVLRRRHTETRRRHPLAKDRPVIDGIKLERRLIEGLRNQADVVIDTTALAPADLRRLVLGHFALEGRGALSLFVTSFAYRSGVPREADLVFDVRFLANPHYQDALRSRSGLDPDVAAFIAADADFAPFLGRLEGLVVPLLPRFEREGKAYLTIAVGCTGGRHRSVMVAERLAALLRRSGYMVEVAHRDLDVATPDRGNEAGPGTVA
ncbi:MAG: RNase adapter RapZ [Alphaproteobacteria bacterium]|nr:RNase adapter RapZ [Alphaproteobacteria bacterium]